MKRRDLSILFLIAFFFQGCPPPYIASGDSDAADDISLDDLQGCLYNEEIYISRSDYSDSHLYCEERCIRDSIQYVQTKVYKGPGNFPDTADSTLAGGFWTFDHIDYDTANVSIIGPQKDGYYIQNFSIWHNYEDPNNYKTHHNHEDFFRRFGEKGWTLCKE
jgi:hypothetical protein